MIGTELKEKSPNTDTLEKLSSDFYTLIPTTTGWQSHEEDEWTSICVHHALHFKCDIPGLEQVLARPDQIENPEVFQVPAAFVRGDGPLTKGKPDTLAWYFS